MNNSNGKQACVCVCVVCGHLYVYIIRMLLFNAHCLVLLPTHVNNSNGKQACVWGGGGGGLVFLIGG